MAGASISPRTRCCRPIRCARCIRRWRSSKRSLRAETWLVLGASSAIARAFARVAAADGADVILAGRDRDDLDKSAADIALRSGRRAIVLDFDALDYASHESVIAHAREAAGTGTLN